MTSYRIIYIPSLNRQSLAITSQNKQLQGSDGVVTLDLIVQVQ
jgi:hypothetical protein